VAFPAEVCLSLPQLPVVLLLLLLLLLLCLRLRLLRMRVRRMRRVMPTVRLLGCMTVQASPLLTPQPMMLLISLLLLLLLLLLLMAIEAGCYLQLCPCHSSLQAAASYSQARALRVRNLTHHTASCAGSQHRMMSKMKLHQHCQH
jgi:hypothetical protein